LSQGIRRQSLEFDGRQRDWDAAKLGNGLHRPVHLVLCTGDPNPFSD
jgi:hypothetical protein